MKPSTGGIEVTLTLRPRQLEALQMLADGMQAKEMAAKWNITVQTVKYHLATLYRLVGADGKAQAIAWAFRNGAVS